VLNYWLLLLRMHDRISFLFIGETKHYGQNYPSYVRTQLTIKASRASRPRVSKI
jgi:hypothetical protein